MSEQAVAVKAQTTPVKAVEVPALMGIEGLEIDDIEIPSIRLLQPSSEKSNEDGYNAGDYIRTTDDKVISTKDSSFGVFVLSCQKMMTSEKHNGSRWEWIGIKPYDINLFQNEEYEVNGERVRDVKTFIYSVLLVDEIKNKDLFPATIQMKMTGIRTAKKINTRLMNNARVGLDQASLVILLGSKQEKNDLGTFFVPTFKEGRKTTKEELVTIQIWRKALSNNNFEATGEVD